MSHCYSECQTISYVSAVSESEGKTKQVLENLKRLSLWKWPFSALWLESWCTNKHDTHISGLKHLLICFKCSCCIQQCLLCPGGSELAKWFDFCTVQQTLIDLKINKNVVFWKIDSPTEMIVSTVNGTQTERVSGYKSLVSSWWQTSL